jgi:hypothetical protein
MEVEIKQTADQVQAEQIAPLLLPAVCSALGRQPVLKQVEKKKLSENRPLFLSTPGEKMSLELLKIKSKK